VSLPYSIIRLLWYGSRKYNHIETQLPFPEKEHEPLRFVHGPFQTAQDKAREQNKFLFVYLHSDVHQDTDRFCRVLCSDAITSFLNEHFIIWGESIFTVEGLKFFNKYSLSSFPFIGVLVNINNTPNFEKHLVQLGYNNPQFRAGINFLLVENGFIDEEKLLELLSKVIEQYDVILQATALDRNDQHNNSLLIKDQNDAYEESLRADQEKIRIKEEEEMKLRLLEEERLRLEKEEEEKKLGREKKKAILEEKFLNEPEKGSRTSTVVIRLTDGTKLTRRFNFDDPLKLLFDYIEIKEENVFNWRLIGQYPRRELINGDDTLEISGLTPQAVVYVEEKVEND